MIKLLRGPAIAGGMLVVLTAAQPSIAQKRGGVLKMYIPDSPASMSVLEEATVISRGPMMGVFNNLVMFDQQVKQNSLQSVVPDLATDWSWNEDGTELSFPLRQAVKWHDGKPFTAADVKCTWDLLMDRASEKLRVNPRKSAFDNIERVSTNGDYEVTFHLKRPQPALLMLIANDFSEIYPCHVSPREMRQHPIGTGPFKFVEFKPNEYIKCRRKIEMSPGVQSRDDTRLAADMTGATGHHSQTPDGILAVRLSDAFDCLAGSGLSYYCR